MLKLKKLFKHSADNSVTIENFDELYIEIFSTKFFLYYLTYGAF